MNRPGKTPMRDRVSHQALLLGGFSLAATLLLVLGNLATSDAIAERQREDLRASLSQVIPARVHDNDLLDKPITVSGETGAPLKVYRAMRNLRVTAVAFEVTGRGYAGDIRLILGIRRNGEILGARVLAHAETPGLGDKIEATRDPWILGFDGLSLGNTPVDQWRVQKDGGRFDAFSGATITPRAVVAAIHRGLLFFKANKEAMLQIPTSTSTAKEKSRD